MRWLGNRRLHWKLLGVLALAVALDALGAVFGITRVGGSTEAYATLVRTTIVAANTADEVNAQFISRHKVLNDMYVFNADARQVQVSVDEVAVWDRQVAAGLARLHADPALRPDEAELVNTATLLLMDYDRVSNAAIARIRRGGDPYQAQQAAALLTVGQDRPISAALGELSARLNRRAQTESVDLQADAQRTEIIAIGAMMAALTLGLSLVAWLVRSLTRTAREYQQGLDVRRAQAELSDERNSLALQAAGMGTWDWDVISGTQTWSVETEVLSGLAPGTFDGTFAAFKRSVHPDDWAALDLDTQAAFAEHRDSKGTYRIVWPDGTIRWIEARARAKYTDDGTLVRMTGTSMDITERKAAEAALQASREQAEQQRETLAQSEKLRALGQMATGIAHDLNQSLMLVASYSDLARQALGQDPPNLAELEDLMTTTTQAALDGGETVKRLLLFTRAAPELDRRQVNLDNLVHDAAQLTAPRWRDAAQAEGRPISLHIDSVDELAPIIQGSSAQLRELLTNLIFNAVDALPTGGTIRLRVAAEDGKGIIEVVDSGVGMTDEVRARVFEPFFTTKGESGTGLGLAMVFGIVKQHGGHIELRSGPGAGTTFRIAFPLAASLAEDVGESRSAGPQASPLPLRVLVVDDEPMMTKAVVRMLRPAGHHVRSAASAEEALELLASDAFDLVVSDMGMGAGMNGWDLADSVKRQWPATRFLLATGWGAAIDPAEAQARGVEAVLHKPYRPIDLLTALTPPAAA